MSANKGLFYRRLAMKWSLITRNNEVRDPFSRDLDNFFSDFFSVNPLETGNEWYPRVDIEEDEKAYRVHAEIPGLEEKDLNVTLEKDVLTISGEKKEEHEEKDGKKVVLSERRYGSFTRSWRLPEGVKSDEVTAEFANGILKIELPKSEEAQPKKIDIQVH